jgi:hypothetical protein
MEAGPLRNTAEYAPEYPSEFVLKYTPWHALKYTTNCSPWHIPSLLDCTFPIALEGTLPACLTTLPIALDGTLPAYLALRSQVHCQDGRHSQSHLTAVLSTVPAIRSLRTRRDGGLPSVLS